MEVKRLQGIKQGIKGFFEAEPLPTLSMPDATASNRAVTFIDPDELDVILEDCREKRVARLGGVSLEEATQLELPFPAVRVTDTNQSLEGRRDKFEDPLAVKIGLWADDIPADGWPDEFDREICERVLSYLPEDEDL